MNSLITLHQATIQAFGQNYGQIIRRAVHEAAEIVGPEITRQALRDLSLLRGAC